MGPHTQIVPVLRSGFGTGVTGPWEGGSKQHEPLTLGTSTRTPRSRAALTERELWGARRGLGLRGSSVPGPSEQAGLEWAKPGKWFQRPREEV